MRYRLLLLLFIVLISLLLSSCSDECERHYTYATLDPVYLSFEELQATPIQLSSPQSIVNPGNIESYEHYLFINEIFNGIHVIDNSNPQSPRQVGFIKLRGNFDIDLDGTTLYADHYTDIVAIDISRPASPQLLSRTLNVYLDSYTTNVNGIIVGWEEQRRDSTLLCGEPSPNVGVIANWWPQEEYDVFVDPSLAPNISGFDVSRLPFDTTANYGKFHYRFVAMDKHLITFRNTTLRIYEASNPENLNRIANIQGVRGVYGFEYNGYLSLVEYWRSSFLNPTALFEGILDISYISEMKVCQEPTIWAADLIIPVVKEANCFNPLIDTNSVFIVNVDKERQLNIKNSISPLPLAPKSAIFLGPNRFLFCAEAGVFAYNFNKLEPLEDSDNRPVNPYTVEQIEGNYWVKAENGLFQYDYSPQQGKLIRLGKLVRE